MSPRRKDTDPTSGEFERIQRMRIEMGLKPLKEAQMTCLRCEKTFKSFDSGLNKLCNNCRGNDSPT